EKLRQQLNFELPLYAASEFYRDHCYHVIDVCLLGEFFLTCCLFEKKSGQGNKRSFFPKLESPYKTDFLKNWYTAALCHDLGYVVERVEKLVGPIEKLKCEGLNQFNVYLKEGIGQGKEMLKKTIESLCADGDLEIADELKQIAAKRTDALDHGIIGWLYLCQTLKQMEIPISTMKHALLAVLRHNLTEHEKNIHGEPLSLLLMLCDHLQEWGRPKVASEQFASGVMEILRFSRQESYLEKQVHLNRFSIKGMVLKNLKKEELPGDTCDRCINNALCKKEETCLRLWPEIQKKGKGLEFILDYQGDLRIEFEPVLSWLYFCHDFQCVDTSLRRFLFPIAIRFTHTLSEQRRDIDDNIPELDIFEEFANTYKEGEAAYLCGWVENARKNKEGIEYKIIDTGNGNGKLEEFIIHLDKLEQPLARGLERNHGRDFLKWKRRWRARKHISRDIGGWISDFD
ncbi:MAG: hypothetical protein L0Y73_00785, partial [Candidatus Aminicenantes bacterium]|nr:hypothetical protein [Candidatus Aminicenantes bacterium]